MTSFISMPGSVTSKSICRHAHDPMLHEPIVNEGLLKSFVLVNQTMNAPVTMTSHTFLNVNCICKKKPLCLAWLLLNRVLLFVKYLVVKYSVCLPRDAMHSMDYAMARCTSVCPSVCRTILVFPYQMLWQYSDRDLPPKSGIECMGGMKKCNFWPISHFISEMTQDTAIFTVDCE